MFNTNVRKGSIDVVAQELEAVRARNQASMLVPAEVVDYARDPGSSLHPYFEWNDGEAAELYRQEQARALIRVVVATVDGMDKPVSAYVRLTSDRPVGQGYRHIVDVMSDEQMASQLVADALADLDRWREKYQRVQELSSLRETMDREVAKVKKTRKTRSAGAGSRRARPEVANAIPG